MTSLQYGFNCKYLYHNISYNNEKKQEKRIIRIQGHMMYVVFVVYIYTTYIMEPGT